MAIGASLTKRDQTLVFCAVVVVLLGAAYGYFLYMPKRAQLATVEEHVTLLDKRNDDARKELESGSVGRLRQQAVEYDASLKVLRLLVPTTNEVPALLENVSTAARRVGLELASVEPMPVLVGQQFDTYRYKVSVKGGYHATAGFLANVGSLNRIVAPVAIDVKQQSPTDKKKARQKDGESTLETDFQIQTYITHVDALADGSGTEEKNR